MHIYKNNLMILNTFIWVTDGKGWNKMSKSLKEVAPDINYILNYRMLTKCINNFI